VLGQLSWQHQADTSLDLSGRQGVLLVVSGDLAGLSGDTLEDISDEGVHDGHGLLGDTNFCKQTFINRCRDGECTCCVLVSSKRTRVHLLEHLQETRSATNNRQQTCNNVELNEIIVMHHTL
jgi:hypothetical protein